MSRAASQAGERTATRLPRLAGLVLALGVAALVNLSMAAGLFSGLGRFFEDLLFSARPVHGDLVIVAVDNQSLQEIGQWPWPRSVFAAAFAKMSARPPAAVGFDIVLAEPSRLGPADDATLAAALAGLEYPVIMPIEAISLRPLARGPSAAGNALGPLAIFAAADRVHLGHVNIVPDRDGVVRRFPAGVALPDGRVVPAFAIELLRRAGAVIPPPGEPDGLVPIAWSAASGTIRRLPFSRLLDGGDAAAGLAGKIVLIGATAADLHDEKPAAISGGDEMSGIEIHANIANMLLSGYRLTRLDRRLAAVWTFVAALIPAVLILRSRRMWPAMSATGIAGAGHLVAAIILFERGVASDLIHTNAAWVLSAAGAFAYRHFVVERAGREVRRVFSKYVSGRVLEQIMANPTAVALGGEEREITILFSDIRGFTSLAEAMSPAELVNILNRYFNAMTKEILECGGVLDKYIGDAIMAFWGAPLAEPEQADLAIRSALGMLARLTVLNQELRAAGYPQIRTGIGIATGLAVVGNIGSEARFNYTAIGDTVNVASRLESMTKEQGVPIIIAESTRRALRGDYGLKALGAIQVKGRAEPVSAYAVRPDAA